MHIFECFKEKVRVVFVERMVEFCLEWFGNMRIEEKICRSLNKMSRSDEG